MVSDIHKSGKIIAFVKPDDANIHVHVEFRQFLRPLDMLYMKRGMMGIGSKRPDLRRERIRTVENELFSGQHLDNFILDIGREMWFILYGEHRHRADGNHG